VPTGSGSISCQQEVHARSNEWRCSVTIGRVVGRDVGGGVSASIALRASRRTFSTALSTFPQTRSSSSPDDESRFEHTGLNKRLVWDPSRLKMQTWMRHISWSSVEKHYYNQKYRYKNFAYCFLQTSLHQSSSDSPTGGTVERAYYIVSFL
jgi:hypothetical protein